MHSSTRIVTRGVAILALVAGAGLVGVRAYDGLTTTRELVEPASTNAAAATFREFECLETALRAAVPEGTPVFVAIAHPLWLQRTAAAAFPDRRLVASPGEAALVVDFRTPAAPAPCEPDVFSITPGGRP